MKSIFIPPNSDIKTNLLELTWHGYCHVRVRIVTIIILVPYRKGAKMKQQKILPNKLINKQPQQEQQQTV